MRESDSDAVLRHRKKWNAKNPAKARRILWVWRIFWGVAILALTLGFIAAVYSRDVTNVIVVVIMGLGLVGIFAGVLAAIFSAVRNEPTDGSPTHVEPGN